MNIDDYALELYEKVYFHEQDLRERLFSRSQITISVAVPILGAIGYLLLNFKLTNGISFWLFMGSLVLSVFFCLWAIFSFGQLFYGYEVFHIPNLTDIDNEINRRKGAHLTWANKNKSALDYIGRQFVGAASVNSASYAYRTERLMVTNCMLGLSLIFLVFSFGVFAYVRLDKTPEAIIPMPANLIGVSSLCDRTPPWLSSLQPPAKIIEVTPCQTPPATTLPQPPLHQGNHKKKQQKKQQQKYCGLAKPTKK